MNTNIFKTAIAALALLVVFNSCKEDKPKYLIEITYDSEQGTVTGGGEYEEGEKATLTAIANFGYCFERWEGYASEDSVITITVTANKSLSAIFSKIECSEYGSVKITISDNGRYYLYEATPNENCYFVKWSDGYHELSNKVLVSTGKTLTATFKPYPEGSIHELFYVSPTKRVIFSKGNLQFNPTLGTHTRADGTTAPGTWRFAEKQTDFIADDTIISATYDGWIDDFAWGTSGWSGSGAKCYQPYDGYYTEWILPYHKGRRFYTIENFDSVSVLFGPQNKCNLTGEYAYADWGVYNPISNGGNKPGMWRTLSNDEFHYFANKCDCIRLGANWDGGADVWYYNGKNPISDEVVNEYWNGNSGNLEKEINSKNVVFFYDTYGLSVWTSSATDFVNDAYIVWLHQQRDNIGEYRLYRHPVRLVMDVEE